MSEFSPEGNLPTKEEVNKSNNPKHERTMFQKLGNRLMVTGQIATLAAVLTTACEKAENEPTSITPDNQTPIAQQTVESTPTYTPTDEQGSKVKPETAFVKIRKTIEKSTDTDSRKEATLALDKFEKMHQGAGSLVEASENHLTNGKPTLVAQQREMFKNLDISPLWEGKYANEDEFLKSRIPFYRDYDLMNEKLLGLNNRDNLTAEDIPLALFGLETAIDGEIYANLNTRHENHFKYSPEVPQDIMDKLELIEPIGVVNVQVEDNLAGAHFTPNPPTITIGINTPPQAALHEFGHATDIFENPSILMYVDTGKAIDMMVARNRAIIDSRQWDDYKKMYSQDSLSARIKSTSGQALTEPEVNAIISQHSNRILVNPTKESGAPLNRNIFADNLRSDTLDTFKETNTTYLTFADFLKHEHESLEKLVGENPYYKLAIEIIRENPGFFSSYYNDSEIKPTGYTGRRAEKYWGDLESEFAPAILTTLLLNSDKRLTEQLTDEGNRTMVESYIALNRTLEREQLAEGIHYQQTHGDSETFREYTEAIKPAT